LTEVTSSAQEKKTSDNDDCLKCSQQVFRDELFRKFLQILVLPLIRATPLE